ncbi:Mannose-6-phosphate isomerase [Tilletia horrida]|uniref:Mannose-6-phosphate isomerase n=1 Tax=Tilletia horrida TaxID=155126 RepID=A0AAN6GNK2_9BASI|nr:Mannose-6-phosphate isomerase [Tilletia horrida]KAK0549920.1 Mannose-6-phosphate isomerase [Tilletia horrida]
MAASSSDSSSTAAAAFQIVPGVQSYDWGLKGNQGSSVARYAQATEQLNFKLEQDKPYAELWMGTHPTLPSKLAQDPQQTLSSYLHQHPDLVTQAIFDKFGSGKDDNGRDTGVLPFLFKVLSIGKALSIQAHPDKELAQKLHKEKPDMYKDPNHKPEMAIALSPFRGFCGFRPLGDIANFVQDVPELRTLIAPGEELSDRLIAAAAANDAKSEESKAVLREVFARLMKAKKDDVDLQVESIVARYSGALQNQNAEALEVPAELAQLVVTLNEQFPSDIGIFCAFVLNVVSLETGQAMFLQANEPHAYLSGQIIECMAASDNVVRAGLTPKARDVDVLTSMLTYRSAKSEEQLMSPSPFPPLPTSSTYSLYTIDDPESRADATAVGSSSDGRGTLPPDAGLPSSQHSGSSPPTLLYDPPIDEFAVLLTRLTSELSEDQQPIRGPSILLHAEGQGSFIAKHPQHATVEVQLDQPGKVYFLAANTQLSLVASKTASEEGDFLLVRAFVEA